MVYSSQVGVIVPYIQKFKKQLIFAVAGLFIATIASMSLMASADHGTTEVVTGDTASSYDEPGTWLFNRDQRTATPYEFNNDEFTVGVGSLYVLPIANDYDGSNGDCNGAAPDEGCDKFIGEYFAHIPIGELTSFSYDFQVGASGDQITDANEFYLNVYANFTDNNNYGDCVYSVVPTTSDGWTTVTFDPSNDYEVRQRNAGPGSESCPSSPADIVTAGAEFRMFALNVGDTSSNDDNLDGYFDKVVVETTGAVTTYDFEPFVRTAEITSPEENATVMGSVDFRASLNDDDVDNIQWAVREGTCAAGTNTVFGNVDGKNNVATINQDDPANQTFEFTGDMSGLENGLYCFIYNPSEDTGEDDIRLTREFNLANPVVLGSKDECKKGGWATSEVPEFKNQGQCVSHFASNGNSTNARNR